MMVAHEVFTYEELLDILENFEAPPGFKSELVRGEIVLSPQGRVHSEIILAGQVAAMAAGLPRWRAISDVLSPFPHTRSGFCPDVSILRSSASRTARPLPRSDIAAAIEVVSGDLGEKAYGIKVQEYAVAGIEAYLIADPYKGLCTLFTGPENGVYPEPETYPFGETVRFTADGTEFVLDTSDWPRIG
ncbi:Uma2 family endonuclease [Streptacidiphilus carbonis]|uniref:Uma2 family endonuclease n=1 Tax=Streptacidiphilus carbonis TaxID=105422 RepID=UPI000694126C|nr:Uma2 family endonuclease [Streptacidiphilus carbonis]